MPEGQRSQVSRQDPSLLRFLLEKMPGELATEKPAEEVPDGEKKETPAAKSVVGIIYPPPEVRSILQMASLVLGVRKHTGQ